MQSMLAKVHGGVVILFWLATALPADAKPLAPTELRTLATKATIVVVNENATGDFSHGAAWLIDRDQRLLVTADHVIANARQLEAVFPQRQGKDWVTKAEDINQLPRRKLTVIHRDEAADLALVQVDRLPADVEVLTLADDVAPEGADLYCVGHPIGPRMFVFLQGKALYTSFFADEVSVGKDGKNPMLIRSENTFLRGDGMLQGTSGAAVLNAEGRVVGLFSSGHELPDHSVVQAAISIREVRRSLSQSPLIPRATQIARFQAGPPFKPKSVVGRWVCRLQNKNGLIDMGAEFTADRNFVLANPVQQLKGTYRVVNTTVILTVDGSSTYNKLTWNTDQGFTLVTKDFELTCERHDEGLEPVATPAPASPSGTPPSTAAVSPNSKPGPQAQATRTPAPPANPPSGDPAPSNKITRGRPPTRQPGGNSPGNGQPVPQPPATRQPAPVPSDEGDAPPAKTPPGSQSPSAAPSSPPDRKSQTPPPAGKPADRPSGKPAGKQPPAKDEADPDAPRRPKAPIIKLP